MTVRILGKIASINVRKVVWTCEELGAAYVREDWGIGFASTRTAEFLGLNPNGLVPVIEDEAGVLWESNTICRYLVGKHRRDDLLPLDPRPRALVEQWMDWQATELNSAWRYAFQALSRRNPAFDDAARIAASVDEWNTVMGVLERRLAQTGAYVAGSDFSLADILLGLAAHRWLMTPMERPDYPAVREYHRRLSERPGFQRSGSIGVA